MRSRSPWARSRLGVERSEACQGFRPVLLRFTAALGVSFSFRCAEVGYHRRHYIYGSLPPQGATPSAKPAIEGHCFPPLSAVSADQYEVRAVHPA
jgi:hypothetical protein